MYVRDEFEGDESIRDLVLDLLFEADRAIHIAGADPGVIKGIVAEGLTPLAMALLAAEQKWAARDSNSEPAD